ncbi:hypothetical protein [Erythrobacter sp.]|uniref:hypothetical protein n=1 Tax=Erythrobacter sp. TaxID=1042 RepID=UPI001B0A3226|nr:hypothetical protein [Erythrobacter sp.]MBO6526339.1 hypothetical protein [Erythrobacter sp.]MBO6530592.1 hypothetical protein [Erythrobacter sp.]
MVSDEGAREKLGVDDAAIVNARANELAKLLWRDDGMSDEALNVRIVRAIEHFNSLKPTDGIEGMLAQQMVGAHFAAIDNLRRAAVPGQSFEARDKLLKQSIKLIALYTRQLQTLNKHRGKGQQKVTVEHVIAEKGGQAIVGNVETNGGRNAEAKPPGLEHKPDETVPLEVPKKAKVRQRKRK